jgi:hypothetical protein
LAEEATYHKVSSYVITNEELNKAYSCLQRCAVANTSTNSSVAYNGRPVVPPMHQDNWNSGSLGSRTLTDVRVREMRNDSSRLKIFSGSANPQLSQV